MPPPPDASMPPPPPPADPDFGNQSFQDLDISAPPIAVTPAARFDAKASIPPSVGDRVAADPPPPDLVVTVHAPEKHGEGMSAYYVYTVETKTSLPQYQFGTFNQSRRFRDFDWLYAQLLSKYPGAIIPPMPEKHTAAVQTKKLSGVGYSSEWLEDRRCQLQRFLQRVASHPLLYSAKDLQTFLEATEETLESWKEQSKQAKAPSYTALLSDVKSGLFSSYAKSVNLLTSEAAPATPPVVDVPCQQMTNYVAALQTQMTAVHKHSKSYIDRHRALSASMTGFGLALTQLANCEQEINASLARGLSQMGLAVDRLSTKYTELSNSEAEHFEDPLKDYIKMLGQCKSAISAREAALKAMNSASASFDVKKAALEKARSSAAKEEKITVLQRDVQEAEEVAAEAKRDYEAISARVDSEMARFKRQKLADMKQILVSFVSLQLQHSQKVQGIWRDLLPSVEAIEATEAAP